MIGTGIPRQTSNLSPPLNSSVPMIVDTTTLFFITKYRDSEGSSGTGKTSYRDGVRDLKTHGHDPSFIYKNQRGVVSVPTTLTQIPHPTLGGRTTETFGLRGILR